MTHADLKPLRATQKHRRIEAQSITDAPAIDELLHVLAYAHWAIIHYASARYRLVGLATRFVRTLLAAGYTIDGIATKTGLPPNAIRDIAVHAHTANTAESYTLLRTFFPGFYRFVSIKMKIEAFGVDEAERRYKQAKKRRIKWHERAFAKAGVDSLYIEQKLMSFLREKARRKGV